MMHLLMLVTLKRITKWWTVHSGAWNDTDRTVMEGRPSGPHPLANLSSPARQFELQHLHQFFFPHFSLPKVPILKPYRHGGPALIYCLAVGYLSPEGPSRLPHAPSTRAEQTDSHCIVHALTNYLV